MIVPLTAAAVWPCGVVLTLAAQLSLVKHTAVGMQVALAPETERIRDMYRHHSGPLNQYLLERLQMLCPYCGIYSHLSNF